MTFSSYSFKLSEAIVYRIRIADPSSGLVFCFFFFPLSGISIVEIQFRIKAFECYGEEKAVCENCVTLSQSEEL